MIYNNVMLIYIMKYLFLFITLLCTCKSLMECNKSPIKIPNFFKKWHCLGINEHIDFTKPYKINVGDLPLVVWKNPLTNTLSTTINICNHMGSMLDNGIITEKGCLKCKYHGKEMSDKDRFGETMVFQDKVFWSYRPDTPMPPSIPFYHNKNYKTSILTFDMDCSLLDSALNMMDIRHPEYVHKLGFGSTNIPKNIRLHFYKGPGNVHIEDTIGLSFDYQSNMIMRKINHNAKVTQNFHIFQYPSFSWSRVSVDNKHLIIAVNLLPLGPSKTRWTVTICYNYYTTQLQKKFVEMMALTILSQDYVQMKNQYPDDPLKRVMLLEDTFPDEEVQIWIQNMFKDYNYPSIDDCVNLYKNYKFQQPEKQGNQR